MEEIPEYYVVPFSSKAALATVQERLVNFFRSGEGAATRFNVLTRPVILSTSVFGEPMLFFSPGAIKVLQDARWDISMVGRVRADELPAGVVVLIGDSRDNPFDN